MVRIDRIYTCKGDAGETDLADGARVSKDSNRVVAYGEVDELNSFVGSARTLAQDNGREPLPGYLKQIQNDLFDLGTSLATRAPRPSVSMARVRRLESWIDTLKEGLPALKSFVLPGGTLLNATLHQCRAICRRAEREVVRLHHIDGVAPEILAYLNRLSDLFFAMARYETKQSGGEEYLWEPNEE